LFRNTEELEKLSELGVLFLLFEMGLELSLDRLKVSPAQKQLALLKSSPAM
jgi:Kef-type K+ transport system membrane component KefB